MNWVIKDDENDIEEMVNNEWEIVLNEELGKDGDRVIIKEGVKLGKKGEKNMMSIEYIGDEGK